MVVPRGVEDRRHPPGSIDQVNVQSSWLSAIHCFLQRMAQRPRPQPLSRHNPAKNGRHFSFSSVPDCKLVHPHTGTECRAEQQLLLCLQTWQACCMKPHGCMDQETANCDEICCHTNHRCHGSSQMLLSQQRTQGQQDERGLKNHPCFWPVATRLCSEKWCLGSGLSQNQCSSCAISECLPGSWAGRRHCRPLMCCNKTCEATIELKAAREIPSLTPTVCARNQICARYVNI